MQQCWKSTSPPPPPPPPHRPPPLPPVKIDTNTKHQCSHHCAFSQYYLDWTLDKSEHQKDNQLQLSPSGDKHSARAMPDDGKVNARLFVDRFYIALFSALKQTHCTLVIQYNWHNSCLRLNSHPLSLQVFFYILWGFSGLYGFCSEEWKSDAAGADYCIHCATS